MLLLLICTFNTIAIAIALFKANRPTNTETYESEETGETPITYGSEEVQAINRSIDERIAEMQAELGITTLYDESTPAPSYDSRVVPLPHNSVRIAQKVDHEYAQ